ncbi:alpha-ketoglutarate-dependent dioxygenase AlkB [Pinirhizobacter sp.]|jgi:alkylated DNA repair dioxygenase AlkB|uniref:alpha-ketoglutarate-dependent dioxygenase AlkB n=1 Tax=Pinirhizobacter sp. TaxID=2950432 RepID=UPI002F3FEDBF
MNQPSLFAGGTEVLLDDASGYIVHALDVIPATTAAEWFARLRDDVPWQSDRRLMYDREVDVPRLRAEYRVDSPDAPDLLLQAVAAARTVVDAPYDSAGLNYYRDEKDSVAPHNDKLQFIREGEPIALLSLGDTRRMVIRAKQPPRRVLKVDMVPGSVLVMSYATQLHYNHGIPKQAAPAGPRISVAFRVRGETAYRS